MKNDNEISKSKLSTLFSRFGKMLVMFSDIECLIGEIISRYYTKEDKTDDFTNDILFHITFERKRQLLEKIVKKFVDVLQIDPETDLLNKIRKIQEIRNNVAHCGMLEVRVGEYDSNTPFVPLKKSKVLDNKTFIDFQQNCVDVYSILIKLGKLVGMNIHYIRPEFVEMVSPKVKRE